MTAKETQPTEEPPNKGARSNYRLSITPTQIIHASTQNTANSNIMRPTQQDSPTEEPPSKCTRSTMKYTSTTMSQTLSQNNPGSNA
eukprot:816478-Pelagomonas_calceolata.AAC.1